MNAAWDRVQNLCGLVNCTVTFVDIQSTVISFDLGYIVASLNYLQTDSFFEMSYIYENERKVFCKPNGNPTETNGKPVTNGNLI